MFPASTKSGGQCVVPGPLDVCKTPAPPAPVPPPMPYPNMAMVPTANDVSGKVFVTNMAAVTVKSKIPRSNGDEPGVAGGLVSAMNMGEVDYKMGSSKVSVEGEKWAHLTSMTGHNGSNANVPAGAQVAPSQAKVIVGP